MLGHFSLIGQCAHLRLDIGKVNGFGREEVEEFGRLLDECEQRFPNEIRLLSIESDKISPHGKRVFCAGANQKERALWTADEKLSHVERQRQIIHRLRQVPFWVMCFVDGLAIGLGAEICLACDFVFATPNSGFSFPEMGLGILPGAGGYTWAQHICEHRDAALAWMQKGSVIDCEHAQWMGIVDECCEPEDLNLECDFLLRQLFFTSAEVQASRKRERLNRWDYDRFFAEEQAAYEKLVR